MDLGQKTEALLRERGWSMSQLAERLRAQGLPKIRHQHISALVRTRGRRVAWVPELAAAFGLTVEQLSAYPEPRAASAVGPVAPAPACDYVHIAALPLGGDRNRVEAVNGMDIAEWWAQQNLPRPFDRVRLMTNRGDALRGAIDDGDLVFVDTERAAWDGPGIYVVAIGGQPQARQLHQRVDGDLIVGCTNPAYPPDIIPAADIGKLRISGRVVVSLGVRRW